MHVVQLVVLALLLCSGAAETMYDFTSKLLNGEVVPLSNYKSAKVVLVVNVASHCGYTYANYLELGEMYGRLHESGLEILGNGI